MLPALGAALILVVRVVRRRDARDRRDRDRDDADVSGPRRPPPRRSPGPSQASPTGPAGSAPPTRPGRRSTATGGWRSAKVVSGKPFPMREAIKLLPTEAHHDLQDRGVKTFEDLRDQIRRRLYALYGLTIRG
jgi:hypothetical protein